MASVSLRCRAAHRVWEFSTRPSWRRFRAALPDCEIVQRRYLIGLLERNRATEYGRGHAFDAISSVESFQRNLPLTSYDSYAPHISRIAAGRKNVLTEDDVLLFEPSSGSTSARKLVPFTLSLRSEVQCGISPWIHALYAEFPGVARGRMYWSITPPSSSDTNRHGTVRVGFDADADYLTSLGRRVFSHLVVSPPRVAELTDIARFRNATLVALLAARDLALISVWSPSFLTLLIDWYLDHSEEVLDTFEQTHGRISRGRLATLRSLGADPSVFERIWPNLTLISCWTDASSAPEARQLREYFPGTAIQGKGLLATEACVSLPFASSHDPVLALRSHFFEFMTDDGDCLAAHQVEKGVEYSVVVTTGGGFYRYRLEDRVLVTGFLGTTPTLRFLGKTDHVCDRYGEKIHARHVGRVLENLLAGLSHRFCMLAPDLAEPGSSYTLYLEFDGRLPADFSRRLECGLRENPHYRLCVELGQLGPVRLFRVSRNGLGSYEARLVANGIRQGDVKPAYLSTIDGWSSHLEGQYSGEDAA